RARSRPHDDLAEHFPILEETEGLVHLLERELAIDDGGELPRADHGDEGVEVLAHPAVRAEDLQLEGPDVAEVLLGVEAGGGAASQHLAAAVENAQRRHPGVAPREFTPTAPPPPELPPVRLAQTPLDPPPQTPPPAL